MHFILSSWYLRKKPRKYKHTVQPYVLKSQWLWQGRKTGVPICLFSPSLPGALTPIIPIHHEKMNRQVEKEKKKKEKRKKGKRKKKKGTKKHGPKCTWYDESSIKLSMIYWLVESHLLKRKTHIQICDQFPDEPFVFHKLQRCAFFFFLANTYSQLPTGPHPSHFLHTRSTLPFSPRAGRNLCYLFLPGESHGMLFCRLIEDQTRKPTWKKYGVALVYPKLPQIEKEKEKKKCTRRNFPSPRGTLGRLPPHLSSRIDSRVRTRPYVVSR